MTSAAIFTYQTRLKLDLAQETILSSYATLYGHVERSLFAEIQAGGDFTRLKPAFMRKFNITARQYNAIAVGLKGKISSIARVRPLHLKDLEERASTAKKVIKKLEKKLREKDRIEPLLPFKIHHKKRRLHILEQKHISLLSNNYTYLCFGGKKLFHAQFNLKENGYPDHQAWLDQWRQARSSEFMILGSKDETSGCQGCVATVQSDGTLSLRLRLPNAISTSGKYLRLEGLRFAYGQETVEAALLLGTAITYRFKRDTKGWRVFASTGVQAPQIVTSAIAGAIGVDVNADCFAASEIDRFGNLASSRVITCVTYGKTSDQRKAVIGDAAKEIVAWAVRVGKPLVIEKLDFSKRKSEKTSTRSSRIISSLAYSQIQGTLRAGAFRSGVGVVDVNPALTSTIGAVNYARRFGISVHQAAAIVIARRGMNTRKGTIARPETNDKSCKGFSERPAMRDRVFVPFRGGHVTFSLPARNRGEHVWSFWSEVQGKLRVARAARSRSGSYLGPAPLPPALGATGSCRWDSGTRSQGKAVRPCVIDDIPV